MVDTDGIYTAVQELDDQDLRDLRERIDQILETRRSIAETPGQMDRLIEEYQATLGRAGGDPWERPTSALDSYPLGAVHAYPYEGEDRLWESLLSANPHEPGVSGWRLLPEKDEEGNNVPPPYVPPTGSHDSYQEGERITWSDGLVYEAVRSGVVHSPDEYAADWQLIEPEPEPEPEPGEGGNDEPDEPEPEPGTIDNPLVWSGDAVEYAADQYVTHDDVLYRVRQDHKSNPTWEPNMAHSLWEKS